MYIKVSKTELKKTANNLGLLSDDLKNEIVKVKGIMDEIKNNWSGTDANNYLGLMEEYFLPNMNIMTDLIYNQSLYLSKVVSSYNFIDETYGKKQITKK